MKILLFVSQLSAGGAEQVAALLSHGLANMNCQTMLAASSLQGEFVKRLHEGCETVDLASHKPIKSLRSLTKVIESFRPDAVICFGISTGIAATLSKYLFRWKQPIITRIENNMQHEWINASTINRMVGPTLSRWTARHSHLITVSHTMRESTENYLHTPPLSITTIPNPVLVDLVQMPDKLMSNIHPWLKNKSTPTFVATGRLEQQKGFDVLINAFHLVKEKVDAKLVIFGEGSLRDVLQKQIDNLQLGDSVDLAGFTNYPLAQMQAAIAFVMSSRFEGFGLVLVEALWSGARVISTACDFGPPELLEGGRYGTLVPVDDAQALAAAMLDSLRNRNTPTKPDNEWFEKFTATEAARRHLELIQSLPR